MKELLKMYWFAALATVAVWGFVGWKAGSAALLTVIVLTLLETTFSADNAVVNSKVLVTMSNLWQQLFMTVGIVFAVFAVRFALPIWIVMLTASLGFGDVLNLALHHPHTYSQALEKASPFIGAFGGTFLLMIALSYFIDYEKETHWLGFVEKHLGRLGQFQNITTFITLLLSLVIYLTSDPKYHGTVFIASIMAMTLHIGLGIVDGAMNAKQQKTASQVKKVGVAAFVAFIYLQILDASFSLDGVIGAFAITNNVLLIMAGLGAGAVWVRAMTVHITKQGTLKKYVFLEHGAHWAIAFLAVIMLMRLYHVESPEWLAGSLGIIFIVAAIWYSKRSSKQPSSPV